jgi:glycosyltransferase involved in cell wall biosynthesis
VNEDRQLAVSVLLPVFFRDIGSEDIRLLRRALDSIRQQEFRDDYEVLVLDDGSAMEIEGVLRKLGDVDLDRLRFIRNRRNQGLVYTLNRGISEARFPLIARLDADDRWLPTKIKKQLDLMAADRDLAITATGMTLVTPEGDPLESHVRPGDWTGILRFFVDVGCPFPHGSVLARRDIYTMLGGYSHNPASSHCEDYALWGIWLRFFKPAMVEEALYDYTVSSSSVSSVHGEQQRRASGVVNRQFRNLDLVARLPDALAELASVMGCSVLDAGMLAYKMWRFRVPVLLPVACIEPLRIILPDRHLMPSSQKGLPLDPSRLMGAWRATEADERFIAVQAA